MVPLSWYLLLSAILFFLGVVGMMTRRNTIIMLMCIELMMNAANLAFVAMSRYLHSMNGQMFVFFIVAIAAAEVSVGLAIIINLFRLKASVDPDDMNRLQG
jgi:NADH-quinone oxidoreductase subunit K